MTLADLLQQFGGGQLGGGTGVAGAAGRALGGQGRFGGAAGAMGGALGGMTGRNPYAGNGVIDVTSSRWHGGLPPGYGPAQSQSERIGAMYARNTGGQGPSWNDLVRKAAGVAPLPGPAQPAWQPEAFQVQQHSPFNVGGWGGMHAALGARGNRSMGGGYGAAPQRQSYGGGIGGSLASLLGGGF